jgi:hypothetical protein
MYSKKLWEQCSDLFFNLWNVRQVQETEAIQQKFSSLKFWETIRVCENYSEIPGSSTYVGVICMHTQKKIISE